MPFILIGNKPLLLADVLVHLIRPMRTDDGVRGANRQADNAVPTTAVVNTAQVEIGRSLRRPLERRRAKQIPLHAATGTLML